MPHLSPRLSSTPFYQLLRCLIPVAAALASTAYAAPAQRPTRAALASSGTDSVRVARFLAALQSAVSRRDSVAVSRLFQYPTLGVWDGRRSISLRRSEQLLPIYGSVFGSDVRRLILGATFDSLSANWQGVTIGQGRVVLQIDTQGDPRIAAVNRDCPPGRGQTCNRLE
jgi:hypothetical protein